MAQVISNSGHDDMIHDAVLDYYGRRLATCSSDKLIKIFEIEGDQHRLSATLAGHEGAVWSIAWAHPKFGTILASASYDGRIFIWREQQQQQQPGQQQQQSQGSGAGQWQRIYEFTLHTASVNLVAWAPAETGCHLAAGSSDGSVSVLSFENNSFSHALFAAHGLGVNAVGWAPALLPGQLTSAATGGQQQQQQQGGAATRRLVTGGSDNMVKIWAFNGATAAWEQVCALAGHGDWVRDVAWSPTPLSRTYVASASQDRTVRVWTLAAGADMADAGAWRCETIEFEVIVWRCSWSMAGNVLAVSGGDNRVSLWKEKVRGGWECVQTIEE